MTRNHALSLAAIALLAASPALAQDPGGSPSAPPPPAAAPGAPRAPRADTRDKLRDEKLRDEARQDRRLVITREGIESGGGGLGIAPPGTWWKNPDTIAKLSLSADQQRKMDDIFRQNRIQLIDVKASLEKEQINLEPLLNANPVDSAKALAEISRIADLRADLEKANAKMLLNLRSVLTAEQWTKLQEDRHNHHGGPMELRFPSSFGGFGGGAMGALSSLDPDRFGDLTDRLADLQIRLGAMSIQIPEIHIPEFKMPPIVVPKIDIPPIKFPAADAPSAD